MARRKIRKVSEFDDDNDELESNPPTHLIKVGDGDHRWSTVGCAWKGKTKTGAEQFSIKLDMGTVLDWSRFQGRYSIRMYRNDRAE